MTGDERLAKVAEVLARHQRGTAEVQARALAPLLDEFRAEDEARALREAADAADSVGHHWSGAPALAFFAIASDLRDRAALAAAEPDAGDR